MIQKDYVVSNKLGLHARPASALVKVTARFKSSVKITKGEHTIDGKSIMGLLMLAAGPGSSLQFAIDGPDEQELIVELDDLFQRKFDDDDKD